MRCSVRLSSQEYCTSTISTNPKAAMNTSDGV